MIRVALRLFALVIALAFSGSAQLRADYLYSVSGLPGPIINGQSFVVFSANPAPNHTLPGNSNSDLAIGNVLGFSANVAGSDNFSTSFVMKLDFADPAHPGSDAVASFSGKLSGSLGGSQPSLSLEFDTPTQNINLAGNTYAISVPAGPFSVAGNGTPTPFGAHVAFTGQVSTAPEPSTFLLAGVGIPLFGLIRRQRRRAVQARS